MTTLEALMNAPAPASAWVLERDCQETGLDPQDIRDEMARRIREMRDSIERGLNSSAKASPAWWAGTPRACGTPPTPSTPH